MEPFQYGASRAAKARFALKLNSTMHMLLWLAALVSITVGALLLMQKQSIGWFVISLTAWPGMIQLWYEYHLKNLPIDLTKATMDGLLEVEVLGRLKPSPSPRALAEAAMQAHGGQFYAARFGLGPTFLQQVLGDNPADMPAAWDTILKVQQAGNVSDVSAAAVIAGLVSHNPLATGILPQLQLTDADLQAGAQWFDRLQHLIKEHSRPKLTGGIARDWSFGYIPHLERLGVNISDKIARGGLLNVDLEGHSGALEQMMTTFGTAGRQNVALVGPLGAGKSSIVRAFAQRLLDASGKLPSSLKFRQVIMLDAAALISAAPGRGQLEELINQVLVEAFTAKNVILCLEDAQLFFEEGVGSVDLTNILLPVLEGGRLRIILTMDEQRWLEITARNPALAAALNRIMVAEASQDETMRVMQDQLIAVEFERKVTFMYQALKESYRLSSRYLHEQSQPGKSMRLLEMAAGHAENGLVTAQSVQKAIEQSLGVKVASSAGTDERQKLLQLEDQIHERMINQSRAVAVVSDALRRARAGVRNEGRPIGTFLFLGPTGVGKTELAKSLAAVYFGGEDHLVRIDLNEYVREEDVARLIADGSSGPGSLTAQVMKQPFSVVLLDEIEKAHTKVLTTLLQMLDEGVLRDINGKEVSFRDAIVIATTNAGADMIRQAIGAGVDAETIESKLIDELIRTGQFRPEFLNRFDETVVFRPLNEEELLQVVDLIIAGINKTLSNQQITVVVDEGLRRELVRRGYDPQLGARPLRRVVQRTVESVIAKRMLGGSIKAGDTITMTVNDIAADQQ
jgi:ATP-dependent Clp protease ATP-binding subunit ClpC